jgi:hypothetical protein
MGLHERCLLSNTLSYAMLLESLQRVIHSSRVMPKRWGATGVHGEAGRPWMRTAVLHRTRRRHPVGRVTSAISGNWVPAATTAPGIAVLLPVLRAAGDSLITRRSTRAAGLRGGQWTSWYVSAIRALEAIYHLFQLLVSGRGGHDATLNY